MSAPVMHVPRPSILWHRLVRWLHAHRPLAWFERGFASLDSWRPDPPVMDRLIR